MKLMYNSNSSQKFGSSTWFSRSVTSTSVRKMWDKSYFEEDSLFGDESSSSGIDTSVDEDEDESDALNQKEEGAIQRRKNLKIRVVRRKRLKLQTKKKCFTETRDLKT